MTGEPFRALGLRPEPGLTDDDVLAAWRRAAAATHPDRGDGGDPAAFAAAAAAYSDLRTSFGRGEALADLTGPPRGSRAPARPAGRLRAVARPIGQAGRLGGRIRRGRPARFALRVLVAAAGCAAVVLVAGWQPASLALITGALIWVTRSGRQDLAPASRARAPWRPGARDR